MSELVRQTIVDRDYAAVREMARALWDEKAEPGKFRFSEITDLSLLHMFAGAFATAREWEAVRRMLERAVDVSRQDPAAHYRLALVHVALGDRGRARERLQQAAASPLTVRARDLAAQRLAALPATVSTPSDAPGGQAATELAASLEAEMEGIRQIDAAFRSIDAKDLLAAATSARAAAAQFAAALQADSQTDALGLAGRLSIAAKEFAEAAALLVSAIELASARRDSAMMVASLKAIASGIDTAEFADALVNHIPRILDAVFGRVSDAGPLAADAKIHLERGTAHGKAGRRDDAMLEYRRAIAVAPRFMSAYVPLAIALAGHPGRRDHAEDAPLGYVLLNAALRINPSYEGARQALRVLYGPKSTNAPELSANAEALAHFREGERLFGVGHFKDALVEYERAYTLDPQFAKAYLYHGDAYFNLQDYPRAVISYERAIRLDPQDDQAQRFLVDGYRRVGSDNVVIQTPVPSGDLVRLTREARAAVSHEGSARRLFELGWLYLARDLPLPARTTLHNALRAAGNDVDLVLECLRAMSRTYSYDESTIFGQIARVSLEDDTFRQGLAVNAWETLQAKGFAPDEATRSIVERTDFDALARVFEQLQGTPLPVNAASELERQGRSQLERGLHAEALSTLVPLIRGAARTATAYLLAGRASVAGEQYETARQFFGEALLLDPGNANVQEWIGFTDAMCGALDAALEAFGAAAKGGATTVTPAILERLAAKSASRPPLKTTEGGAETKSNTTTEPAASADSPSRKESPPPSAPPTGDEIDAIIRRGQAFESAGDRGGAFLSYTEARGLAADIGDEARRVRAHTLAEQLKAAGPVLVSAAQMLSQLPALRSFVEAPTREAKFTVLREMRGGDARRALAHLLALGVFYYAKERNYAEALVYAELARENVAAIPADPPPPGEAVKARFVGDAELLVGDLLVRMGEYTRARTHLERAVTWFAEAEETRKKLNLAVSDFSRLFQQGADPRIAAYGHLATVAKELGNSRAALDYELQALALAEDQSAGAAVDYHLDVAEMYRATDEFESAFRHYRIALQRINDADIIRQGIERPGALRGLSRALLDLGLYQSAIRVLLEATRLDAREERDFDVAGQGRPPVNLMEDHHWLGMVYDAMGDPGGARKHYLEAMRYATLKQQYSPNDRILPENVISVGGTWPLLGALGSLEVRDARSTPAEEAQRTHLRAGLAFYAQAIELIEGTRRRQTGEALVEREQVRLGYTRNKATLYQDAVDIEASLDTLEPGGDHARQALRYAQRSKSQVLLELIEERGVAARDGSAPAPDVTADLRRQDRVVVEYFTSSTRVYAWAFGGRSRAWAFATLQAADGPLTGRRLDAEVRSYLALLSSRSADLATIEETGRALYQLLFPEPIRAITAGRPIVVIPHGPLHLLPFGALYAGREPLGATDVSYSPSSELLARMLQRRAAPPPAPRLLSVINPAADPTLETRRQRAELPVFFGPPSSQLLTDRGATSSPQAVLRAAAEYDYLHIFAHGTFNPERPLDSLLDFGGAALTAVDLYRMSAERQPLARTRLVTLVACETGRGDVQVGDEVLGLPRAFLHAGAAAMVTTLWRTDAAFSDRLIPRLYEKLAAGTPRAEALRAAVMDTIALRPEYRHPFYWAPFVLIGDPR